MGDAAARDARKQGKARAIIAVSIAASLLLVELVLFLGFACGG